MTYKENLSESTSLSPSEAFSALGNETRIQILHILAQADHPLAFTEVREGVDLPPGRQFNYHLKQLIGHFVRKTDDGYELSQAGRRVVQAVLSEAMTDNPVFERAQIDHPCRYCGAPIEVRYHEGHLEQFCTECDGLWDSGYEEEGGYLGCLFLPPAGLRERSAEEAFRAGWRWTNLLMLAGSLGMCPRCSAKLDERVNVCDAHEVSDGSCNHCNRRYAIKFVYSCTNCIFETGGNAVTYVAANIDVVAFLSEQNCNPVAAEPASKIGQFRNYDEVVHSLDPLEAEFRFTINSESLTLTIDQNLDIVEVTQTQAVEAD